MLSPHDLDIVRRDKALSGLGIVLDSDALLSALEEYSAAGAIQAIRPSYLRYKPGTNCLVSFDAETNGTEWLFYVKAHGDDANVKLPKVETRAEEPGPIGWGQMALDIHRLSAYAFPNDAKLRCLRRLVYPGNRGRLHRALFTSSKVPENLSIKMLAYKPERRYVASLCDSYGPKAVLKLYTKHAFARARITARSFRSRGSLRVPACLGEITRYRTLGFEWLPGRLLRELIADSGEGSNAVIRTGAALAQFHAQMPSSLSYRSRYDEAKNLMECAAWLAQILPSLSRRVHELARRLADWLVQQPHVYQAIHGDFYAKQVVISDDYVGILDLDEATWGDPCADLGLFIAHLERDAIEGSISANTSADFGRLLAEGYHRAGGHAPPDRLTAYVAIGLLQLSPHPFRRLLPSWPHVVESLLSRAELLTEQGVAGQTSRQNSRPSHTHPCIVHDPLSVIRDERMPFITQALDPLCMAPELHRILAREDASHNDVQLTEIRATRHKPGRRCVIEYDFEGRKDEDAPRVLSLVGKLRAKGLDARAYRNSVKLWCSGFSEDNEFGVSIPEPVGQIPILNMWLQRKVVGVSSTHLLSEANGVQLAKRIGRAIYQLHQLDLPLPRHHTIGDELRILGQRLDQVGASKPRWRPRLRRLVRACERLATLALSVGERCIHRDFYSDHVLVTGDRLHFLDFDLFCRGDPSLDVGNFSGHLIEQGLRLSGDAATLANQAHAFEEAFLMAAGRQFQAGIQVYRILTLVRHIHISSLMPDRHSSTGALLQLCEELLLTRDHSRAMP